MSYEIGRSCGTVRELIHKSLKWADKLLGGRIVSTLQHTTSMLDRLPPSTCPFCNYNGKFGHDGRLARIGVRCPSCQSLERHRLFALAVQRGLVGIAGRSVLHFAPEDFMTKLVLSQHPSQYQTSNYPEKGTASFCLDIEAIALADSSFDVVICSHVLEHIDDRKALKEIYRILAPGGMLIAMVPIIEGWATTYEDPSIVGKDQRTMHYGQWDHVRFYGADFRDRISEAGFERDEFTANGPDSATYRLGRGAKVFLGRKQF